MSKSDFYLGLGANLGQPLSQLKAAVAELNQSFDVVIQAISPVYRSAPMGPQDQSDYYNAVIQVATHLSPELLLNLTQAIENQLQRHRKKEQWGPRTIDIDLLVWSLGAYQSERLKLPHYHMSYRDFVILPLHDIAPHLTLENNLSISAVVQQFHHRIEQGLIQKTGFTLC